MKAKTAIIVTLLLIFTNFACKKKSTDCWVIVDIYGNEYATDCGKTEDEMRSTYPNPCNYYKSGEPTYCWYTNDGRLLKDKPESYIAKVQNCLRFSSVSKVPCDYCQTWYSRQKYIYKPTSSVTYSYVSVQRLCGDTVRALYAGREIVLRETADSIIAIQFNNKAEF
jgi:hypothetical protein